MSLSKGRTSHLLNKSLDFACGRCCLEADILGRMIECVFMSIIINDNPSIRSTDDFMVLVIRDYNPCKPMASVEQIRDSAYTFSLPLAKR